MGQLQYIYNSAAGPRIVIDNINGYTGMTRFEVKFSLQNNPSVNPLYLNFPFYEGNVTLGSSTINFNGLSAAYVQDQIYTIGCGNGTKYINETVSPFTSQQRSDTYHMWFNANAGGRVLMHIYYLKFFDVNDNVILDFVPYDDNGSIGLKDINENLFYTNWSGASGSWIAGPPYVPPTPSIQVPINKYKLGPNNISKTYEGGTKINKMYVGNDLAYIALPTTTGPQLQMPLNEVWYKTTNNNSIGLRSGTYYTDSNGNQLTYTQSFDSVSGLWKMVFSDDVYGCQGAVYYNSDDRLVEVWYPYGYVKPNPMFAYGQTHLEKFKGDSPAIVDNGNAILCLVDCNVDGVNGKNFVMQAVTSGATTINIPEGALGVGPYSFFKATAITISLPSTITYVGNYCFERTNLTTLNCYATTVPTTFSNIWYAVGNSGTLHYPTGSDYSSFPVPSRWTKVGDL